MVHERSANSSDDGLGLAGGIMIIDTDNAAKWIKTHSRICIPIATGFLSWFAAVRWQAAINQSQTGLMVFYFFASASNGVITVYMICVYFIKLELF